MKQLGHKVRENRGLNSATRQDLTKTAGEVLHDGAVIELVWADAERASLNLLVYKNGDAIIAPTFENAGKIYAPADIDLSILRATRFPIRLRSFGSARELYDDTAHRLSRRHDLPEESIALATYFVFSAWSPEHLPTAPLLSIIAPPPALGEPLMQDFSILCRRPLLLNNPNPADLLALPFDLRPTLLLHVSPAGPAR